MDSNKRCINRRHNLFLMLLSATLLLSSIGLVDRILEYRSAADEYAEIARQMASPDVIGEITESTPTEKMEITSPAPPSSPVITPMVFYNPKISSFRVRNEDTVGFLEISDTNIKYPVLQGEDNTYYENHTFTKQKNASGAIFLDSQNASDLSDFNLILYGHNMKDGSMFHDLLQYRKAVYAGKHREIKLTGLYQDKVFYAFAAYACSKETDIRGFKYGTTQARKIFLKQIMGRSVISAGLAKPSGNEQIITLVTCRENADKDYFVVHAILIE